MSKQDPSVAPRAVQTRERMEIAPSLDACVAAGLSSNHVDLAEANVRKIGVYEETGSNNPYVKVGRIGRLVMERVAPGVDTRTPHTSGTSLNAQARYNAGTNEILDNIGTFQPQRLRRFEMRERRRITSVNNLCMSGGIALVQPGSHCGQHRQQYSKYTCQRGLLRLDIARDRARLVRLL